MRRRRGLHLPEQERDGRRQGGAGEDVTREVDAERDPTDGEDRRGDKGDHSPAAVAEEDRRRDRERAGGVVARKSGVGRMRSEQMNAVRVDDEGPRAVDEVGDHLAYRQGDAGADHRRHRRPAPRDVPDAIREQEDHREGRDEQRLGDVDVEEERILDVVVVVEEVVEGVKDRPIHALKALTERLRDQGGAEDDEGEREDRDRSAQRRRHDRAAANLPGDSPRRGRSAAAASSPAPERRRPRSRPAAPPRRRARGQQPVPWVIVEQDRTAEERDEEGGAADDPVGPTERLEEGDPLRPVEGRRGGPGDDEDRDQTADPDRGRDSVDDDEDHRRTEWEHR